MSTSSLDASRPRRRLLLSGILTLAFGLQASLHAQAWIRTYGSTLDERPRAIAAAPDDGCVVVGAETSGVTLSTVTRLDAAGNVVWQRVLDQELLEVRDAVVDPSGDVVIVGRWDPAPGTSWTHTVPWIAKLDGVTGTFLWAKTTLPRGGLNPRGYFTSVTLDPSGGYVAAGLETGAIGFLCCKLDSAGKVEWQLSHAIYGVTELPTEVSLLTRNPFLTTQCATNTAPWANLGSGLAGGVAHLAGVGTLQGSAYYSLILTQAQPSAPAALVFGNTQANTPVFGGILVPAPDLVLPARTKSGAFQRQARSATHTKS